MVRDAFESGTTFTGAPRTSSARPADGARTPYQLVLTSERRGDVVLLRIDEVDESSQDADD